MGRVACMSHSRQLDSADRAKQNLSYSCNGVYQAPPPTSLLSHSSRAEEHSEHPGGHGAHTRSASAVHGAAMKEPGGQRLWSHRERYEMDAVTNRDGMDTDGLHPTRTGKQLIQRTVAVEANRSVTEGRGSCAQYSTLKRCPRNTQSKSQELR